jgi:hypothetical protein
MSPLQQLRYVIISTFSAGTDGRKNNECVLKFSGRVSVKAEYGTINLENKMWCINPLKMKRICFIKELSAYRAVNTLHLDYKNQSLNVL